MVDISVFQLANFAGMIDKIGSYALIPLIIMAVYYLFRTVVGGEGEAGDTARAVGGGIAAPFKWLKGKGQIRGTEEFKDKYGKYGGRNSKKAFNKVMNEFISEKTELKIIEDLQTDIEEINDEIHSLAATADLDDFKKFSKKVNKAKGRIKKAANNWRNVKKNTFKAQTRINGLIKKMENEPDADHGLITRLRTEENLILKKHNETARVLASLQSLIEGLYTEAEKASKAANVATAQGIIAAFTFSNARTLIDDAHYLQGDGSSGDPGVFKIMEGMIADLRSLI